MNSIAKVADHGARFVWVNKAIVFVDVVESALLIESDEAGTLERWLNYIAHVRDTILPEFGGQLVKSLGDGMLLQFDSAQLAVAAAFSIRRWSHEENALHPPDRKILLRFGIELSDVIAEKDDVFGRGVNVASRLLTLAGPGQIVISAQMRDHLTGDLDADIEDLGECYLKHLREPVRAYRISPPQASPAIQRGPLGQLMPSIAVVPFASRSDDLAHFALGEVLAEEIIGALSLSPELTVISRLSTSAFARRHIVLEEIVSRLRADYVVTGRYGVDSQEVVLDLEIAGSRSGQVILARRRRSDLRAILNAERELIAAVVADIVLAVEANELQHSRTQSLPTLRSYTLLIAAIALMHRLSLRDFEEARQLLDALIERQPRQAVPQAWLAKWYVLGVQQGWSTDQQKDAHLALECTKRALDADPYCSLAWAMDGIVHTNLLKRLDLAQERYETAIAVNPNDALAWLLKGTLHAFKDEGQQAVKDTQRALTLTPLDPHRYFYDSLAATACLSARDYAGALVLAQRSLRANRTHTSTLRVLAASQWRLGQHKEAGQTAQELLRLEPDLTVSKWLERSPSAPYPIGKEWADLLRQVGIPD